jgi:DNA adenine methylase
MKASTPSAARLANSERAGRAAFSLRRKSEWHAPLFRWAGSKKALLPILVPNAPVRYARYIEPFAGSASLFFALRPREAILGDLNAELIHAYEVVRDHPELVAKTALAIPSTRCEYDRIRALRPGTLDPLGRAVRFIYLNRYCFNGVYRTDRLGRFNVPRGSRTGRMPEQGFFRSCAAVLRTADLRIDDFESVLANTRSGDFVYLDPPYVSRSKVSAGGYGPSGFTTADLPRLARTLDHIDKVGATFILSYENADTVRQELSEAWHVALVPVRRTVASLAKHRQWTMELLASNRPLVV